ncbi:transposase [Elysia marginata]|uniref:Transposase n=1 Tax=Elysia marginata TaxID=1093978 RepID=A0AAV4JYL4_9GAST|nr:transposase [Elysia marginata]
MKYTHKSSPSPRKFKVVACARKVMLTVFWDSEGIVHIEFLTQRNTVNSERYISTLRKRSVSLSVCAPQGIQYCTTTTPGRTQVARLKRHYIK